MDVFRSIYIKSEFSQQTDPSRGFDPSKQKVNLILGTYRDDDEKPFVLQSVRKEELKIMCKDMDKEYAGMTGDRVFERKAFDLTMGEVLFYASAYNPRGVDPTPEQWNEIIAICKEKQFYIIIDFAYQGFGSRDPELDAYSERQLAKAGIGMAEAKRVESQVKLIASCLYTQAHQLMVLEWR
ncbi:aspartate aminotransferase, mitochondrial-like [Diabrotica undecimpunctata]|uniref:aspartate aminotransferase, mitochondrial-like n=1 Tax=Diabrotica undecimpunctata TaxID=50387 RepID=UPI003B64114A